MLQILKRKDAKGYEEKLSSLGLDVIDTEISEAIEDDKVTGYGIYKFSDGYLYIYDINSFGDLILYDGIVRSILFLAALKGIEKAVFKMSDIHDALALGFVSVESNVLDSISGILGGCSGCGHNC